MIQDKGGDYSPKQPLLDRTRRLSHLVRHGRQFVGVEAVAGYDLLEELGLFGIGGQGGFKDPEEVE